MFRVIIVYIEVNWVKEEEIFELCMFLWYGVI